MHRLKSALFASATLSCVLISSAIFAETSPTPGAIEKAVGLSDGPATGGGSSPYISGSAPGASTTLAPAAVVAPRTAQEGAAESAVVHSDNPPAPPPPAPAIATEPAPVAPQPAATQPASSPEKTPDSPATSASEPPAAPASTAPATTAQTPSVPPASTTETPPQTPAPEQTVKAAVPADVQKPVEPPVQAAQPSTAAPEPIAPSPQIAAQPKPVSPPAPDQDLKKKQALAKKKPKPHVAHQAHPRIIHRDDDDADVIYEDGPVPPLPIGRRHIIIEYDDGRDSGYAIVRRYHHCHPRFMSGFWFLHHDYICD